MRTLERLGRTAVIVGTLLAPGCATPITQTTAKTAIQAKAVVKIPLSESSNTTGVPQNIVVCEEIGDYDGAPLDAFSIAHDRAEVSMHHELDKICSDALGTQGIAVNISPLGVKTHRTSTSNEKGQRGEMCVEIMPPTTPLDCLKIVDTPNATDLRIIH